MCIMHACAAGSRCKDENPFCACAGTHCEGGVWATLFGLLLWPALFAAVPDALRRCALVTLSPHC